MHTKCWAEWNGPLHLHTWVMLLQMEVALRVGADTALICCSWARLHPRPGGRWICVLMAQHSFTQTDL